MRPNKIIIVARRLAVSDTTASFLQWSLISVAGKPCDAITDVYIFAHLLLYRKRRWQRRRGRRRVWRDAETNATIQLNVYIRTYQPVSFVRERHIVVANLLYICRQWRNFLIPISPSPPIDSIWALMLVWRIRGKIIRTARCSVVYDSCACAQWYAHTWAFLHVRFRFLFVFI